MKNILMNIVMVEDFESLVHGGLRDLRKKRIKIGGQEDN